MISSLIFVHLEILKDSVEVLRLVEYVAYTSTLIGLSL